MSVFCKALQCCLATKPCDLVLVEGPERASLHTAGGKKCGGILTTTDLVLTVSGERLAINGTYSQEISCRQRFTGKNMIDMAENAQ